MIIFQNWTNSQRSPEGQIPPTPAENPPEFNDRRGKPERVPGIRQENKQTSKRVVRTYGDPSSGENLDDNVGKP